MKERRPVVLSLIPSGTARFPRYRIADQFLRYWTGQDWSEDEEAATVYEDSNVACGDMQKLLMLPYMNRPCRHFRAPVMLDLYADKDVPRERLVDWLTNVSKLLIDSPHQGNGPLEGTLGLCRIEWDKLEEVK